MPSAMLRAPASSGSSSTLLHRIDSPRLKRALGQVLAEAGPAGIWLLTGGQGAQAQRAVAGRRPGRWRRAGRRGC